MNNNSQATEANGDIGTSELKYLIDCILAPKCTCNY